MPTDTKVTLSTPTERLTDEARDALDNWVAENLGRCDQCSVLHTHWEDDAETCECCDRFFCPECSGKYGRYGARVRGEQLDADLWETVAAEGWVCHNCQTD